MEMVEETQNNQPQNSLKRINFEEDRRRGLPDYLLVDMLSRLPSTKDLVRIGTLSKRWKHVWA